MFLLFLCSRRIEELSQSLAAREKLVEQLSQEKQQLLHLLEEPADMEVQVRLGLYFLRHLLHAFRRPTLHINVLVFYCCVSNYCKLSGESRHDLADFSAQGLTSLKSRCQLGKMTSQLEAHLGKDPPLSSLRLLEEYCCAIVEVMAASFFTAVVERISYFSTLFEGVHLIKSSHQCPIPFG